MKMRLQCHDLAYKYPESDTYILEKINCSFSRPGFHSVFGPSGVGKSTFARIIAAPSAHQYEGSFDLQDISTILYSYNLERLPGWSSAGAHLDKVVPPEQEDLKRELIEIFGLAPLLKSRFHQLSMGQQNRVNLIRYLLQDFDVLILDESLANVDEKLRKSIILTIKRIFPDKMFLYISHNLMEVSTFCDEIMVFGASSTSKSYKNIEGQNCCISDEIDKTKRDQTMLEIMNAF